MCVMGNYDKTVFIDRDGVINKRLDGDYVKSWSEFEFLSKAKEAVRRLSNAVYDVIVVSNQAGINKGAVSASTVEEIHRLMLKKLSDAGGKVAAVYYCPHRPDENCDCRKPKPGMLLQAAVEHGIELRGSYLVGDSATDIEAGAVVGCRTILVMTGKGIQELERRDMWQVKPDYLALDLNAAVDIILSGV